MGKQNTIGEFFTFLRYLPCTSKTSPFIVDSFVVFNAPFFASHTGSKLVLLPPCGGPGACIGWFQPIVIYFSREVPMPLYFL